MLTILRRIIQDVRASQDVVEGLRIMAHEVQRATLTQICMIFLIDKQRDEFVLAAGEGLDPTLVGQLRVEFGQGLISVVREKEEPINLEDASTHPNYHFVPELGEERFKAYLGVPIIHYGEVLGVLVVLQENTRRFDEEEEAFLVTLSAQLAALIANIEVATTFPKAAFQQLPEKPKKERVLKGLACVPGVAIGTAKVIYPPADLEAVPDRIATDIPQELALFEKALAATKSEIETLSEKLKATLPEQEQALFDAYIQMLSSESLGGEIAVEIEAGNWAQGALRRVIKSHVRQFEAMDNDYLRERALDIKDLGRRILSQLQRVESKTIQYPEQTILVGEEVTASALAEVPEGYLKGIVSVKGSSNSHVAILARALGIPTIMGIEGIPVNRLEEKAIILDGYYGQMYVSPSAALYQEFVSLAKEEEELAQDLRALRALPAETSDGHKFLLFVNTGLLGDAGASLTAGAQGVGLFRSEIAFMNRDRFPTEKEQTVIYRQMLKAFAPSPVVMRTLDIGGDKNLPYFPIEESNPFLGWRGIRVTLDHPEIFLVQVRAMLRASIGLNNLRIMLPMVSHVEEVIEALRFIHQAHQTLSETEPELEMPKVGVMIEVPSAVYQAQEIARRVDFLSVGSNDLTQYLLAVDRNNARVAGLYDGLHPAVVRALQSVVNAAHREGIPVSICGEMAADPAAVLLLMGLGFDVFSMNAASLPRVKSVIRAFSLEAAKTILAKAMKMIHPHQIHDLLVAELDKAGLGGLIRAGKY